MSGLLSRWNLRRQKVEQEAEAEIETPVTVETQVEADEAVKQPTSAENTTAEVVESDEAQLLTAEDLPDPEKIEVGGSFASFMGANVDPVAKSAALKALWKQPHYSEIDGLLEYALDYSNQPKLSAEVSAELAKKVFRHVVKEKDDEEENEEALALESDEMTSTEETVQVEAVSDTEMVSDILDGDDEQLSQNEPEHHDDTNSKVV